MDKLRDQEIIRQLIVAREMGRQGPRWNRAFRKELWLRLKMAETRRRPDGAQSV